MANGCVWFSMPSLIEIRKSKLEKEGKKKKNLKKIQTTKNSKHYLPRGN
jgi:hypothetical protein